MHPLNCLPDPPSLYFLIRKGFIKSHGLIISPGGCFMKRQQLMWLFLSLSGRSAHTIPGIDWRNLLFFISLSPVLHLIPRYFTLSFCCLSFSTSIVWVSLTLIVWGRTETGVVWTFTWAVWISVWVFTETKATLLGGGSLTFSFLSLEPQVQGQSRTGGSWSFHTRIYTLRT